MRDPSTDPREGDVFWDRDNENIVYVMRIDEFWIRFITHSGAWVGEEPTYESVRNNAWSQFKRQLVLICTQDGFVLDPKKKEKTMRDPREDPQRGDILRSGRVMITVLDRKFCYFAVMDHEIDCVIYQLNRGKKFITAMECWADEEYVRYSAVAWIEDTEHETA